MTARVQPLALKGAAAVVTGAGSGVGEAVCAALAAAGARLHLIGRREEKLQRVAEESMAAGAAAAEFSAGDVGDADFCVRVLASAAAQFGRLDLLINNAGVIHRQPATATSDADWARVIRTNLDGVFYLSRAAIQCMRAQSGGGAIVNIASTVGLVGASGLAAYCASKGGVAQLTRALAVECAPDGVTVNAVCPGAIDTPMLFSEHPPGVDAAEVRARCAAAIPQGRLATAAEVARAALFLAAEPHITGALLPVDGGYTAQ